ncbi:MAG TPA: alkaline phosphatase D family protein [Nocardioidaceae bacterium]|nr:alkaline phosphatase D family protein [Nocardioidaceae bacterium]
MTELENSSRRRHVFVLGILIVLATVSTSLAAFANPPTDEWLYVQIRALDLPTVVSELSIVRMAPVIGLVGLLGVLGWRCRALVTSYALALAGALTVAYALMFLVARPRPYDSYLTGDDSYPSPAIAALTVIAVMIPVCLRVLTGRRLVADLTSVVLWVLVLGTGLEEIHAALRWPLDVVGAILLGGVASYAALAAIDHPSRLHAHCADCRWQRGEGSAVDLPTHHGGAAHPLYRAAAVWTAALVVVFGYLAYTRGIPRDPESGVMGTGLEVPLNLGLLLLMVIGVIVTIRRHMTGAIIVALAALLLGYAASVQYAPWVTLAVASAAFVPALLLWVQWHAVATVRAALAIAVTTAGLFAGLIYLASSNYSAQWGPTHPTSATPAPPGDVVDWMWSGAVTPTSVNVRARTEDDVEQVRLVVGTGTDLSTPTYSQPQRSDESTGHVVSLRVRGLEPDRDYYYALELDGETYTQRVGHFRTFPRGPSTFTFAFASCARTGSNGVVYDAIRRQRPLFFLSVGDWFYGDVDSNDPDLVRRQYEANLSSPSQAALYASTPFAYVWDDHDFGGNDADSTAPAKPATMDIYRRFVPHYPLRDGPESPIFQAFTVGDVRFVLTDPRSAREPPGESPRSLLGDQQRRWLLRELRQADQYGLVVWANGAPWVGRPDPTSDRWTAFAQERRLIADTIAENGVDNLLMVSGDAHMLAYDDGTHTDYSPVGDAGFPLFHAASLDRRGSIKGGPYTGPVIPGGGQFGTVEIRDDGATVRVTMTARNWKDEVLFTRTFSARRD